MPLLCSFYACCEARDTLRQGEWISDNGETLVSAGGRFEFGFFSPTGSSGNKRYVGIWYHEWDNRTVVWVANRDSPIINANGVFNVTEDAELKVLDTTGKEYWSADIRGLTCPCRNRTLTLNNSGNLVFGDFGQHANLWESFNTSTHTLLPGMDVNQDRNFTSWKGFDDPGEGSFRFFLGYDEFNNENIIYKDNNIYCISSQEVHEKLENLSSDFTARIVMDFSGKLEYWRWDVKVMNWSLIMAEPGNKCAEYNYCGNNGVCNPYNNLVCKCLPGFKPNAPEKWHSGDFSNGCARNSLCGKNDVFLLVSVIRVDNSDRVEVQGGEPACQKKCFERCDCKAYYYYFERNCHIWTRNLVDLQEIGADFFFVRVAISDIGTNPNFHMTLLAFTEVLKLQLPAAVFHGL